MHIIGRNRNPTSGGGAHVAISVMDAPPLRENHTPPEVLHYKEAAVFQTAIEEIGTKTRDYSNNNSDDQNLLEIRGNILAHPDDTFFS